MAETKDKTIIYAGPFSYPTGGAAARRISGVAKSMQAAGFEVKVACGQMSESGIASKWFEGIEVISLSERTAEHLPRALKHMAYFTMGKKTVAWLETLKQKPHAVVLYSGYSPYLLQLLPWARLNGVPLIFDAVEWYDPGSLIGWLSPYQLNIELALRVLIPRTGRVISISSFLHRYFSDHGCMSINMPPTLDVSATEARTDGRNASNPLELVYAGTPGRKDLLDNILEAVLRLRLEGHHLHLSVAGLAATEAATYAAVRSRPTAEVSACVDFLGVLNHNDSIDLVRKADFSLLLRHDARYSRAGFPTKFVESFSVGTPVIANLTSDLHRYLQDEVTGFACAGPTPENLATALKRALALTPEQHANMRLQCRAVAAEAFDYRAYVAPIAQFLCPAET